MNFRSGLIVTVFLISLFCCLNAVCPADEMDSNYPSASFTFAYTNASGAVTQATVRMKSTDETNSALFAARNSSNFLSLVRSAGAGAEGQELAQCLSTNRVFSAMTNSTFTAELLVVVGAAATFFDDLRKQGRLPGVQSNSHGEGSSDSLEDTDSWIAQKIKYPFSITINLVLTDDSLTNHYTLTCPSKDSSWQLQRAWRTDLEGHVVKEWPVKSAFDEIKK